MRRVWGRLSSQRRLWTLWRCALLGLAAWLSPASLGAADRDWAETQDARQAASLDLEQLANMDVIVTSASKKEETISRAPAAIYVISSDDIQRSGLSSLPELLRMVPGMTVQHVSSHAWTVSTRGFNGFPNEKMLVLIDGRAVYDPLYGGVNWDVQDLRLQDVERIEVIRGPGGTLWGSNAVNGVINVITQKAQHTQGMALGTSLGKEEGYRGSARYGGQIGAGFFYRVFAQSSSWEPFVARAGAEMFNGWSLSQAGLRSDWDITPQDSLTMDAGAYRGNIRDTARVADLISSRVVEDPYQVEGGHILGRWKHSFSNRASTDALAYCDWSNRSEIEYGGEYRNTCDLELQHDYVVNQRISLVWGGGLRSTADQTRVSFRNYFTPAGRRLNLGSLFAQGEWVLVPDKLRMIGGSKFESNTYTGFELQPQVRMVWTPAPAHNIWGAVSRSVRTPTRNERDNFMTYSTTAQGPPPAPPLIVAFAGNDQLHAERQNAYEIGYRYQYATFSFDGAAFYSAYTDLIYPDFVHLIAGWRSDPTYLAVVMPFTNQSKAQTHGLELSAKWKPIAVWALALGVTENRGTGISMYATPRHQFSAQSRVDLPRNLDFDSALYHTNAISIFGPSPLKVPTSNRVDLGVTWRGKHGLSVGVWGRNVQSEQHAEGSASFTSHGDVPRAVGVKMEWEMQPEKRQK